MPPTPPPLPSPAGRFADLAGAHRALEEAFLQHQEALLSLELAQATAGLERYAAGLRRHLEAEEALLLPPFTALYAAAAARGERWRGADPELFRLEHARLLALLDGVRGALAALTPGAPRLKRAVLALLEQEGTLRHLAHHHELREETHLFPALDVWGTEAERAALRAAFARATTGG
jgi:hemerythrin-like domain-containing protein